MKRVVITITDDGDCTIEPSGDITPYDCFAVMGVLNRFANGVIDESALKQMVERGERIAIAKSIEEARHGGAH